MNSTLLIILAVAGLALVIIGAVMRSGPKVTHIETRRHEDRGDVDGPA